MLFRSVHLNELVENPGLLEDVQIIGFPGGFSYGDDIAAGRIFANRLKHNLLEPLQAAVRRGTPIIGICNGFQVLGKLGLLPDPEIARQSVTLADNHTGRFTDRWVGLEADSHSVCVWTRGLAHLDLPIAHGEGRFVAESQQVIDLLRHIVGHPSERLEAVQMGASGGMRNDDRISITIRFQDGSLGTLHYFGNGPATFPKERIEVFVAGRALQIDNFRVLRAYGWPGMRTIRYWRQDKGHEAEMKAFVRAVQTGGPAPIRYEELAEGMRLCFRARAAASERGSP